VSLKVVAPNPKKQPSKSGIENKEYRMIAKFNFLIINIRKTKTEVRMEKQFECIDCKEIVDLKKDEWVGDYYLYVEDDGTVGPLCKSCSKVLLHGWPDIYSEDPKNTEWSEK
jgi:hypothetical protein